MAAATATTTTTNGTRRSTRTASTTAKAPAAVKQEQQENIAPQKKRSRGVKDQKDGEAAGAVKVKSEVEPSPSPAKNKRVKAEPTSDDDDGDVQKTPAKSTSTKTKGRGSAKKESTDDDAKPSPGKTLADRKLQLHRASAGKDPFAAWPQPTPQECEKVAWLLGRSQGYTPEEEGGTGLPAFRPPQGEDKWGGCGDVKDVLDATIRTILSCNTSGKNSSAAHRSMTDHFGRDNYKAVLEAPHKELEEVLRCGGLANTKAKNIQGLLRDTQERFGKLSLQHLHDCSDDEVTETLISFSGVGPKVASCVQAFCLGRPHFAVDTHVQRLTLALGWVPPQSTRETTHYHCQVKIPPHLRYPLHTLLIAHGKRCYNCRAKGGGGGGGGGKKGKKSSSSSGDEEGESEDESKSGVLKVCPLKEAGLLGRKFKNIKEMEE